MPVTALNTRWKWTQPCRAREFVKSRDVVRRRDAAADRRDLRRVLLDQRGLVGLAALAGTKARLFRIGARGVEPDVLAPGAAGGARRPAIDAGRSDRVVEFAVERAITRDDRRPSRILVGRDLGGLRFRGHEARHSIVVERHTVTAIWRSRAAPALRLLLSNREFRGRDAPPVVCLTLGYPQKHQSRRAVDALVENTEAGRWRQRFARRDLDDDAAARTDPAPGRETLQCRQRQPGFVRRIEEGEVAGSGGGAGRRRQAGS